MLPSDPPAVQEANKSAWNSERSKSSADFYTVGYAGRSNESFIDVLKSARVSCVIDVRSVPVSRFNPKFSKNNLRQSLDQVGIEYVHLPSLGVPTAIRQEAAEVGNRDAIWDWYADAVVSRYARRNLGWFFDSGAHPVALMCVELDPTTCHRHLLADLLERLGFSGYDL